jgi:hypothetical protein
LQAAQAEQGSRGEKMTPDEKVEHWLDIAEYDLETHLRGESPCAL